MAAQAPRHPHEHRRGRPARRPLPLRGQRHRAGAPRAASASTPTTSTAAPPWRSRSARAPSPASAATCPARRSTSDIAATRMIPQGSDAISPGAAPRHLLHRGPAPAHLRDQGGDRLQAGRREDRRRAQRRRHRLAASCAPAPTTCTSTASAAARARRRTVIRDHVGIPIEIAVAVVDQRLRDEGIRHRASIIAAGSIRSSADLAKAIALGADAVAIGTAALIALGCHLCQGCHTGSCSWGLTTHKPGAHPAPRPGVGRGAPRQPGDAPGATSSRRCSARWASTPSSRCAAAASACAASGWTRRPARSSASSRPACERRAAPHALPAREGRPIMIAMASDRPLGLSREVPPIVRDDDVATIDCDGVYYRAVNDAVRAAIEGGATTVRLLNVNGQRYIGTGLRGDGVRIEVYGHAGPGAGDVHGRPDRGGLRQRPGRRRQHDEQRHRDRPRRRRRRARLRHASRAHLRRRATSATAPAST